MKLTASKLSLAPTDLSNYQSCRHATQLDLSAAQGELKRLIRFGPIIDELRERGMAHENAYLEHLKSKGLTISQPCGDEEGQVASATRALEAMKDGFDVVFQAALGADGWSGRADFLIKVPGHSSLGGWSYEVTDTKLARETKAGAVLQLCVYTKLLADLQGSLPQEMHIVRPGNDFEPVSYRVDDYSAYFRLLENGIQAFVDAPAETYPEPVSHCDVCNWWTHCESRRRADDHLCYVAGISTRQIETLKASGITTLTQLAELDEVPKPNGGSQQALERARDQARIQHAGRSSEKCLHQLHKPIDGDHGLSLLPEPTPDDIFLDFEGDHFAEDGVNEYLTGYLTCRPGEELPKYTALWASNLHEERVAFEAFVDFAIETRRRNPGAHIYHFAPYETTALKRLVGRYATRERELDELLRGGAFIDLHRVVRRSLIASVERYSIKDMEPFFGYERQQDLAEASMSRRLVETAIASGAFEELPAQHQKIVEDYNREDCESALRLRDWLEVLRSDAITDGHLIPRPDLESGEASDEISELDQELRALRDALLDGLPEDPNERSEDQAAQFILAHMMEFHRREDKAAWWEFFRLTDLDDADYLTERRSIAGPQMSEVLQDTAAPLHRYQFGSQDVDARKGDDVYDSDGEKVGSVADVNFADQTIDIKKSKKSADVHPSAMLFHSFVRSDGLRKSLMRLGATVCDQGLSSKLPYKAGLELLLRRPSPLIGANGDLQQDDELPVDAAVRLALQLNGNVLAIQGPPGAGKTYTGAKIICALKKAGKKVGVTAVSHKVIQNVLEGAAKEAKAQGIDLSIVHKNKGEYAGDWGIQRADSYPKILKGLANDEIDVVGATAWAWCREDFEQSVDVLIVDEAGQMALSNVLATAPAAESLILLGDPQQLEQPLQSSHPEGSDVSALTHWLGGENTMPKDRGLFLDKTYRLHPKIAAFTSEVYYEKRLGTAPDLDRQAILSQGGKALITSGSGLRFLPVEHAGNQARSTEEVEAIAGMVRNLLDGGLWQPKEGDVRPLTINDILVVAPYNAQVAALSEALPELQERIGTVDRFQGQEAPVVIYSMTSSSPEDAPRGMSFLYDPHRFNVATSRALAMCVLVGNPSLFAPECRTPAQMKMANGFCRYLELAEAVPLAV